MKIKSFFKLVLLFTAAFFMGCERELDTEGISRITYFPTFEMAGDEVVTVVAGSGFTDPGVTATESGAEIPVTATGQVDANTPGLYVINYSATNKDGFSANTSRTIVVLKEAPVPDVDLSGEYTSTGTGGATLTSTVTKVSEGVYFITNGWGSGKNGFKPSSYVLPYYFISTDGVNIEVPEQITSTGDQVSGTGVVDETGSLDLLVNIISSGIADRPKYWQKL